MGSNEWECSYRAEWLNGCTAAHKTVGSTGVGMLIGLKGWTAAHKTVGSTDVGSTEVSSTEVSSTEVGSSEWTF